MQSGKIVSPLKFYPKVACRHSFELEPSTKTTTMKTILKTSIALLGLLFGALTISNCAATNGSTHNMGNPKNQNPMSDNKMPARN